METAGHARPRFQYSIRALVLATAIVALGLTPLAWLARERQRLLQARDDAIRAVVLAERAAKDQAAHDTRALLDRELVGSTAGQQGSGPLPDPVKSRKAQLERIQRLEGENAKLKETNEQLRSEVARLRSSRGR